MTFNELKVKANRYPLFKLVDVFKWFPKAQKQVTLNQLHSWCSKGYLEHIRKGVYKLSDFELKDSFVLTNFIYPPSYISLESALNYYGIIPDIPFAITSVTINKTASFKTEKYGTFLYSHVKQSLFFGFQSIRVEKIYTYTIALPEKALFDYLYLRIRHSGSPTDTIRELRLSVQKDFHWRKLKEWAALVSAKDKIFHAIIQNLAHHYDT
ncbi:MAG: hypothetical protein HY001_00610 [Candidatus Portnoybacteria bacterium]|nr:hypothetical protein [Candidatus Portnoybacteria bacterium]